MLPVQPSSASAAAAIPSTIHLTREQRRELEALWSEIAGPRERMVNLKQLPPEVRSLAEQMDAANGEISVDSFFTAAAELQRLVPDIFEGYFEMVFRFLERGIQSQENVAFCRENLSLIRSLIKPGGPRENQVSRIIAKRNLLLTRNIASTKEILGDLSDSCFWLNQSAFLIQSCDGQEMQQLLGISKELDLIVYLKLGDFSQIAKILEEVPDEHHLPLGVPTLFSCMHEIAKIITEPLAIKQILDHISEPRKASVISHFKFSNEKNIDLVLALAEFTEDPKTKADCYGTVCSSYLESNNLISAVEVWKIVHKLVPGTILDFNLAEKCMELAFKLKDVACAHEIVKHKSDDQLAFKMIHPCLNRGLLFDAVKALKTINDETTRRSAHGGMALYHLLQAGLNQAALEEVIQFLEPKFEQNL